MATASSGPEWTGESDGLVGRDALLADVGALVAGGGRVALVLGSPGAGKTAVLEHASRSAVARGWTVLSGVGHESERDLAFALLLSLVSHPAVRADPSARVAARELAERVAPSGGDASGAAHPLRLRLGFIELLESLTEASPVMLVIDDAQWADDASMSVLAFVARRLRSTNISLLLGFRGDHAPARFEDHPVVVVPPLPRADALRLLHRSGLKLAPAHRDEVIEQAEGNPLALLELGRSLNSGASLGPGVLALSAGRSSVERLYAHAVEGLADASRWLLMLAAAGGDQLDVLYRAADGASDLAAAIAPAERAGLAYVADGRLLFRHPLARAAAYSSATTAERLEVHRRLADAHAGDPERQAWHRAAATLLPDEEAAAALAAAAGRAQRRGAYAEASRAMVRAAELTPDRSRKEQRLVSALAMTLPTGQVEWLAELAAQVRDSAQDQSARAHALHYLAFALAQTMRQTAAVRALDEALEQLLEIGGDLGWGSLTTLASLTYQSGGDRTVVGAWLHRYEQHAPPPPEPIRPLVRAARTWVRVAADPLARPPDLVALVRDAATLEPPLLPDQIANHEMLLGASAWLLDQPAVAQRRLRRAADVMQRSGWTGQLPQTYAALGQVLLDIGSYDEADEVGRLLVDLADAENLSYVRSIGGVLRARVAAIRGDVPTAQRLAQEVLLDVEVGEALALECNARAALAGVCFAERDEAGRYELLRGLFHPDGTPIHPHLSYRYLADLVSAAIRADQVENVLPVMSAAADVLPSPLGIRQRLHLHRARALLAGNHGRVEDAESHHRRATEDPAYASWPLELAQARLEYGSWLRRRQRLADARPLLREATLTLERLGARPWAEQARLELRAAGAQIEPIADTAWDELTAQERHVVRLAASGMTNREIGAALYLSPRTVSAHLYRAFPKLGVTSRAQLRDVIDEATDAP